jgi:hypothetical protein
MSTTDNLVRKARFLRNAAPQQFADFCGALAEYTATVAELMIAADGDLQLHQGRAQQCAKILRALEDAKNG